MRADIERVIAGMREGYAEDLTLAMMAEMARLSPFHMARLFREETGLPPVAFLAAVRMEEARRQLLRTDASVADISVKVGYSSVGSFTSRFTRTVGLSPGRYRRLLELGTEVVDVVLGGGQEAPCAYGAIEGVFRRSDGMDGETVYVAAFPAGPRGGPSARRRSACCRRVEASGGTWRIAHVPEGVWYAQAVSRGCASGSRSVALGSVGPLRVAVGEVVRVDLELAVPSRAAAVDELRLLLGSALPALFES